MKSNHSVVEYSLAQLLIAANKTDVAHAHALKAVSLANELLEKEPASAKYMERVSLAHTVLGEALLHLDEYDESKLALEKAISIGNALSTNDQTVSRWVGVATAQPKLILAKLHLEIENNEIALKHFGEVATHSEALVRDGTADPITVRRYCSALAGSARQFEGTHNSWDNIIDTLSKDKTKHGPEALALLAEAFARKGAMAEAMNIVSGLQKAGYRHPEFLAFLNSYPEVGTEENLNLPSPVQRL